jgi:hypothetical protein
MNYRKTLVDDSARYHSLSQASSTTHWTHVPWQVNRPPANIILSLVKVFCNNNYSS